MVRIADTPHARVMTHTFFPSEVPPVVSGATMFPITSTVSPLVPTLSAATPPMESFFSPLSLLPNAPSSLPVPPMMNAALSAGRLYRSPAFLRELGAANPEWNLAHSYPFQSLAFGAFS